MKQFSRSELKLLHICVTGFINTKVGLAVSQALAFEDNTKTREMIGKLKELERKVHDVSRT